MLKTEYFPFPWSMWLKSNSARRRYILNKSPQRFRFSATKKKWVSCGVCAHIFRCVCRDTNKGNECRFVQTRENAITSPLQFQMLIIYPVLFLPLTEKASFSTCHPYCHNPGKSRVRLVQNQHGHCAGFLISNHLSPEHLSAQFEFAHSPSEK